MHWSRGPPARFQQECIEFALPTKSWEVLEFVDYDLIFIFQRDWALIKYIQGDAHRLTRRGRHTGGKHVLVNDTAIARGWRIVISPVIPQDFPSLLRFCDGQSARSFHKRAPIL